MAAAPLGEIPVKETASNVSWLPWTDIAFFLLLVSINNLVLAIFYEFFIFL